MLHALAQESTLPFLSEVVALLGISAIIAYLCFRVGLVPIVGFLIAGVVIGPNTLGLVQNRELIDATAEIGIILLLFTIGIEFSLGKLAQIRNIILIGGGFQVGLTVALVTGLFVLLGLSWQIGVFSGCLIALSSTAIILKLLSDRSETNAPVGQIALGVSIFQDLTAIIMVLLVPMLSGDGGSGMDIVWALLRALAIILVVLVVARRIMPPILEVVARTCSTEIFLLTVIAICFGTAWLTNMAGVSLSLGAFLAGLIVSESSFSEYSFGEILPLQILFSATFFVSVGMLLDVRFVLEQPLLILGVVAGILVIKMLTTGIGVIMLGYPLRTALLSGFFLAQVGEFSFVLERVGRSADIFPLGMAETGGQTFIAATVILMVLTPFLTQFGYWLDNRLAQRETNNIREAMGAPAETETFRNLENHVIVVGYGECSRQLVRVLRNSRIPYVITTLNPGGANEAEIEGLPVLRGDGSRLYTLSIVNVERAKMIVNADDDPAMARRVVNVARLANPTLSIIVRTRYTAEMEPLTQAGADIVIAEELESTVQLFAQVLEAYRISPEETEAHLQSMRAKGYAVLRQSAAASSIAPIVCKNLDEDCMHTRIVTIREGAHAAGQTLQELNLAQNFGLQVQAIQRDGQTITDLDDKLSLVLDDQLVLVGSATQFAQSADVFRVGTLAESDGTTDTPSRNRRTSGCTHTDQIRDVLPRTQGCEECMAMGEKWVHLRMCLICGHVGCCDSSKHKHAAAHFHETEHPIVQSIEPGEDWRWCYIDKTFIR
ncbi:MAG: hypothetical protein GFH25_541226n62 [Chloroflexi bacterium AL-N10]|nr:hypothetical protein [Chloroflexi bacterium AL-N1]NOK70363.1 hypothetical protein [Chloroflexi bacterium AL-N10]NOK78041.1 hypothetical protein [Chloroflexi bacterium AL-N5]NOK92129.1 hypothetical protein [Chloroflexi bacterium AL-N15]